MTDRPGKGHKIRKAVHRHDRFSRAWLQERMFSWLFSRLVYPMIWEDPEADMRALRIGPDDHVVAIASGGCNVLSYLPANPARITALDLNPAHVALNKLKIAGITHLPDHETFYRFFGIANDRANILAYRRYLRPYLDDTTRAFWDKRTLPGHGRRRISLFARNFYRHGLLGYSIGAAHVAARLFGARPKQLLEASSLSEQRTIYETVIAPVFETRLVRWLFSMPATMYGLGIPPAQYEALAGGGSMAGVVKERVERLACDFPISENYFAWQAFGRQFPEHGDGPVPPYLRDSDYEEVRERVDRLEVLNQSVTEYLAGQPDGSADCYILLDAQDWMTNAQLDDLWSQINRTARPGARALFRTAAEESLLPGRLDPDLLGRWRYDDETSRACSAEDRSAVYGAMHLYVFNG